MTTTVDLGRASSTPSRVRRAGLLAGACALGLLAAGLAPASAQSNPVFGLGNHFFLAGAGNVSGKATQDFYFGDGEEMYFGDLVDEDGARRGDGIDDAIVQRGNEYIVRVANGGTVNFVFGNRDDEVYVGDWDGNGTDTLMVRRGNQYFVANELTSERVATSFVYTYGNPGDAVYAGNWDGNTAAAGAAPVRTDTLMVRRGNQYFVKNSPASGTADYDFRFGDPNDKVLIGDWATPPVYGDNPATPAKETRYVVTPGASGNLADQLAVKRGNVFFQSQEVATAQGKNGAGIVADRSFAYGNPDDEVAFAAAVPWTYDLNGKSDTLVGDGLGIRRNG